MLICGSVCRHVTHAHAATHTLSRFRLKCVLQHLGMDFSKAKEKEKRLPVQVQSFIWFVWAVQNEDYCNIPFEKWDRSE